MGAVNRNVLFGLLAAAALFVGMLAYVLLSGDSGGFRDSRREPEAPEQSVTRGPRARNVTDSSQEGSGPEKRGFAIVGTVREERGAPIFGAALSMQGARAITDREGRYELVVPTAIVVLDCWAEGFLPVVGRRLIVEGSGPVRIDFDLKPAAVLSGRVLDENGRPVRGARVYVISPDRALLEEIHIGNLVSTDKQGHFRFPGVAAGTWDLGVRARGHLPALARNVVVPVIGTVERDVQLRRGRAISVEVRNATSGTTLLVADSRLRGKLLPPGGLQVLVDAAVGRQYADFPVVSGMVVVGTGWVSQVTGASRGAVDAHAADSLRIPARELDSMAEKILLVLGISAEIEIRVQDESTREALDPKIFLDDRKEALLFVGGAATVPADDKPHVLRFRLDGYEDSKLDLPANRKGWPEVFEVTMRRRPDGETGRFTLEFDTEFDGRVALVGRDADGRWAWQKHLDLAKSSTREVKGVPFGEYTVSVLATGMIPVVLPRVVVAKGINDRHRVSLHAGGGIEMRVVDEQGQALDKVGLLLKDHLGNRIDVHIMTRLSDRRAFVSINSLPVAATVRADSGLAPGIYTLTGWRDGYLPATEEFTIVGRDVAKVTVTLSKR